MSPLVINLPWPPSVLSPNGRHHWAKLARSKKAYRASAVLHTMCARGRRQMPEGAMFSLSLEFYPPDRRRYDRDNLLARMKAGLDGVADALGINDEAFCSITVGIVRPEPPGKVVLRILTIGAGATR